MACADAIAEEVPGTGPQATAMLIGQDAAEAALLEAFTADRLHHAWLLTGPRGVGKATLAFRFARFLLDQPPEDDGGGLFGDALPTTAPKSLEIPEDSDTFQRVASLGHGGLRLIQRGADPKTGKMRKEITVDDVRALGGFFGQTAAEGGWRVAIIDAADEMNRSAANALLKILEEPPARSILLLIAHSPGRLLPTIRSRCRALKLSPLSLEDMDRVMTQALPDVSEADRQAAMVLAEGAPGRALHLASGDTLDLYRRFTALMGSQPRPDVLKLQAFAGELGAASAEARYRLMIPLMTDWLARMTRAAAQQHWDGPEAAPGETEIMQRLARASSLDRWVEVWENVAHLAGRADALNLDRKQVLMQMFALIQEAALETPARS